LKEKCSGESTSTFWNTSRKALSRGGIGAMSLSIRCTAIRGAWPWIAVKRSSLRSSGHSAMRPLTRSAWIRHALRRAWPRMSTSHSVIWPGHSIRPRCHSKVNFSGLRLSSGSSSAVLSSTLALTRYSATPISAMRSRRHARGRCGGGVVLIRA
jgi:hypothetical protein